MSAEKARRAAEAADAAAKAAQVVAQGKADNRLRVEQGIPGEWVGNFGGHGNARFTITRDFGAFGAMLLSDGWREVFRGELLDNNNLLLTGISAARIGSSSSGTYSLDTVHLELGTDGGSLTGQFRDAAGHIGNVEMRKSKP